MLTEQERNLVHRVWSQGPAVLLEEGMTADSLKAFLGRHEVQAEFSVLDGEFNHATDLTERTKFLSRRNLARLSGGAAATLAKAMRGPQHLRNNETGVILKDARGHPILMEASITQVQIRAAEAVLDALGVTDRKGDSNYRGDFNINVLVEHAESTATVEHDPDAVTPKQRAISRERVRTAMLRLEPRLPLLRERLQEATLIPTSSSVASNGGLVRRKKAKKKKAKKKGAAKGKKI